VIVAATDLDEPTLIGPAQHVATLEVPGV
jgi:hypothetical protein